MLNFEAIFPYLGLIVGGLGAYYGAANAMRERLARLEAHHESFKGDIHELRSLVMGAHERINALTDRR